MSEVPAEQVAESFQVEPLKIRGFAQAVHTAMSEDGKKLVMMFTSAEGALVQVEMPFAGTDSLIDALRGTQAAARGGLITADKMPSHVKQNGSP